MTYQQQRRANFKAQGLCYICGKRPPAVERGQQKCTTCITKYQKPYDRNYRLQTQKLAAFEAYGGCKCVCCGETNHIFLSLDHVNNDGAKHRRSLGWITGDGAQTGGNIYSWVKARGFPPGFQVMCHNCNHGRHLNGGVCPHQEAQQ